ncbi:type II secretion system protein GspM [Psychrobacter sp. I-STPA6b]|uniref:type II secretion system protein GspM n=1 Tax=Psychrobacter sp. I-STPA6b TaxID=2585718 RepID=UPI001D0C9CAB|nr:type II secretion system protein GspM [Psychrobacter sp. I-STPA6b]
MIKKPSSPLSFIKKKKSSLASQDENGIKTGVAKTSSAWQQYGNQLQQRWQALPSRDQLALMFLAIFLLLVVGGYGGYELNRQANTQQASYQAAVSDYFWLRGQAGNINSEASLEAGQTLDVEVKQQLSQAGINNPQVLAVGDGVQLSFIHNNQAVISNALDALVKKGLSLSRLNMQQNPVDKSIQVQVTVTR